jgi:hypothetical protein
MDFCDEKDVYVVIPWVRILSDKINRDGKSKNYIS